MSAATESNFHIIDDDGTDALKESFDVFSDVAESDGSALSDSKVSVAESQQDAYLEVERLKKEHEHPRPDRRQGDEYLQKFCFYKFYKGLKLPTLMGDGDGRYSLLDIIRASTALMQSHTVRTKTKLSLKMISGIKDFYQEELGAVPLDLIRHLQV